MIIKKIRDGTFEYESRGQVLTNWTQYPYTLFSEAFDQTLHCHPHPENVFGDGVYGCRWINNLVSANHATPYFLPRSNVTFKSKMAAGWYDMLFSLWRDSL